METQVVERLIFQVEKYSSGQEFPCQRQIASSLKTRATFSFPSSELLRGPRALWLLDEFADSLTSPADLCFLEVPACWSLKPLLSHQTTLFLRTVLIRLFGVILAFIYFLKTYCCKEILVKIANTRPGFYIQLLLLLQPRILTHNHH